MPSMNQQEWLEGTYAKSVSRFKERRPTFDLTSGTVVEPLYTSDDLNAFAYAAKNDDPGPIFRQCCGISPVPVRGGVSKTPRPPP